MMKKRLLTLFAFVAILTAQAQDYTFSLVSNSTYNFSVVATADADTTGDADLESFGFTIMLPDGATIDTGNMTINYGLTLFMPVAHYTAAQLDAADPGQDRNATVIATNSGVGTIPAHTLGQPVVLATFDVLGSPVTGAISILDNADNINTLAGGAFSSYIQIDSNASGSVSNRYIGQSGTTSFNFQPLSVSNFGLKDVSLYPNPAKNKVTISGVSDLQTVEIISITGKRIQRIENATSQVNISHLPTGVYFIKIYTATGVATKKVVKQ